MIHLEPLVVETFLGRQSLAWIFSEHRGHQVLGFIRDRVPIRWVKLELRLQDILENFLIVVSLKGWISAQEDIQDDSKGPDVAG